MHLVETNFVKEIENRINQMKSDYDEADSQYLQHKYLNQIEMLELVALPLAKKFHYNLNIITNCLHKKDKYIEQLQAEIRSLKGDN